MFPRKSKVIVNPSHIAPPPQAMKSPEGLIARSRTRNHEVTN